MSAWIVAALAGVIAMGVHAAMPGDPGDAATRWPADSRLPRVDGRPTLVMFVEAGCPCSSASLGELARLLDRAPCPMVATVVVRGRAGGATEVAGARFVADPEGEEAGRFGVATSGHVLLFGADGRLAFSGGITPGRGHRGESLGAGAILDRLAGRGARPSAPVFGCPIHLSVRETDEEGP